MAALYVHMLHTLQCVSRCIKGCWGGGLVVKMRM